MNIFKALFPGRFGKTSALIRSADEARLNNLVDSIVSKETKAKLLPGDEKQLMPKDYEEGTIAFVTGTELLNGHKDKIQKLIAGIGLPRDQFHALIYPVIERYADFVHLLPASKAHHHMREGGLLEHGLDAACFAVNTAVLTSFDYGSNPSMRTIRRERWYAAATFAALLHDGGKPLSDMEVHDERNEHRWPGSLPIFEWALEHGFTRYFITWTPNRGEKHKIISPSLLERFIPKPTRDWIREGGNDIYHAMIDAIACNDPKALLTAIVIKSDSASVELNLRNGAGGGAGGSSAVVNVPSNFTNAAQYLLEKGIWTSNTKGSRIWVTTAGVFIAWKTAVPEVVNYLDNHKIKGCPRGSDSLGSVLVDHGLLEPTEEGNLYWGVAPDVLTNEETGKRLWLKCVKLISAQTLYPYDAPPAPIAVCIGSEEDNSRYDPLGSAEGEAAGVTAGGPDSSGFMSPMFSLDTPAAKPVAAPAEQVEVPVASKKPVLSFEPADQAPASAIVHSRAPAEQKPAASRSAGKAKASDAKPKPNVGKTAQQLGITLGTSGPAPGPALVVGGVSARTQPVDPIVVGKKSAPASKNGTPPAPAAKPVEKRVQPVQPKQSTADVDDPFGSISGIDGSMEREVEQSQVIAVDELVDPFAGAAVQSGDDPFKSVKVTSKAPPAKPAPAPAAPPAPELASCEEPLFAFDDPAEAPLGPDLNDLESQASEEVPMFDAEPVMAFTETLVGDGGDHAGAVPEATYVFTGDEAGLSDFDPEIMEMMGLAPARSAGTVQPVASVQAAPVNPSDARPGVKKSIPAAFRMDSTMPSGVNEFLNIPMMNPSGFDEMPDELRMSEAGAGSSLDIQAVVPMNDEFMVASDDDLSGFDLPEFVGDVVLGGAAHAPVAELVAPAEADPGVQHEAQDDVWLEMPAPAPAPKSPQPQTVAPVKKAKPVPLVELTKELNSSAIVIGRAGGDAGGDVVAAVKGDNIKIGAEVHKAKREQKKAALQQSTFAPKPVIPVLDFSPVEVAGFESFLGRTSDLREKLLHHCSSASSQIIFSAVRPFIPFSKKADAPGFRAADIEALHAAGWVWHNFNNPKDPRTGKLRGLEGFYLSPFLADCLEYLSGGSCFFDVEAEYPSSFDAHQLLEIAQKVLAGSVHYQPVDDGKIHRFTAARRTKVAVEHGIKVADVERALIDHTNFLCLDKYWLVLAADEHEESSDE